MLAGSVIVQAYYGYRRSFSFAHLTPPLNRSKSLAWLSILNKWLFLIILAWAIHISIVTAQLSEADYQTQKWLNFSIISLLFACAFFVRAKIDWLFNLLILISSFVIGTEVCRVYQKPPLNESVVLQSPYPKAFYVLDGGNSRLNSAMKVKSRETRRHAMYLLALDQPYYPEDANNRPYPFNFGETLIAPADGTVVTVVDSFHDSSMDAIDLEGGPGNYILIEIAQNRYLLLAHLRKDSIRVQEGDRVRVGQAIAQAGKSGMVTMPATLMCVFDNDNVFAPETRSLPIYFERVRKLDSTSKGPYFPSRNDIFQPE